MKQVCRRMFSLPSSAIGTELQRERGASWTLMLGAVPRGLMQVDTDLWGRGPQEGRAGTSVRRWQPWLAAALRCTLGPSAPLPAAAAEHNRVGTWQLPAPSASRPSTRWQGWRRPSAPAPAPAPRVPPAPVLGSLLAGLLSGNHIPRGAAWCPRMLATTPSPLKRCHHSVPVPRGLAPRPNPLGVPSP